MTVRMERKEWSHLRGVKVGGGLFHKGSNQEQRICSKYCLARCVCVCVWCNTLVFPFQSASELLGGPHIGQLSQKAADQKAEHAPCWET